MPILNFCEIPEAHIPSGLQDTFELFARDFFVDIFKFKVLSEPNRGADGGKDILFEEYHAGTLSESKTTWLVSCKHKAHSGSSVSPTDEESISDRLLQFKADGFIGFYSTITSSGLNTRLDTFKEKYNIEIFDREKIEKYILNYKNFDLMRRYFPVSYKKWSENEGKREPSRVLETYQPLYCDVCGIDLFKVESEENRNHGIIAFVTDPKTHKYVDVYTACVGKCDRTMQAISSRKGFTAWDSLSDLLIPTIYLQRYMAMLNRMSRGNLEFEPLAFNKYKKILIAASQFVFRHQSDKEMARVRDLAEIPEWI